MNQKIRILIGTPCGGGQASTHYMLSMIEVLSNVQKVQHNIFIRDQLRQAQNAGQINEQNLAALNQLEAMNLVDMEIGLYTLANESLLGRGRNHIANVAIRGGWNKLFFIDADARFSVDQFMAVALSPYDFTAGVCPLKILPISLNYLPFEDDEFYHKDNLRSVGSLLAMKAGHKKRHIPIAFVGTAFMCLSRKVLLDLASVSPEYQYPNPQTGHLQTHWDIFSTGPMFEKYSSEDWSACQKARDLGYDVMIDSDVIISHVGTMLYGAEMANIQVDPVSQTFISNDKKEVPA